MSSWEAFFVGIAPQHVPALIAVVLLPVLVLVVRRLRPAAVAMAQPAPPGTGPAAFRPAEPRVGPTGLRWSAPQASPTPPDVVRMWAAWLLGIAAAVHLGLPLGHHDGPVLTVAFLASGAAYAWLAMRAFEGRSWRLLSGLLVVATLIAYLVVAGSGGEEPDQVGIATALVELAALGLCLVPIRQPGRPRRVARFFGSTGLVVITFLVGVTIWIGSFLAHAATDAATDGVMVASADGSAGAVGHTGDHAHEHEHAARAQAGVIMRPIANHHPTVAQRQAADQLAAATKKAMARYATLDAAVAAGYVVPKPGRGTDVHMEHKTFKNDGRILDPQRPEMLVFAIEGGRATLLGVVFVMQEAGSPGPEPGGAITRWHAHNICLTALPPGFGIVSPFGTCPALSVNVTVPEMMHVWVVDNPQGAFAEGLDEAWVRAYHATHGRPT
jgi:hypothetical protein